MTILADQKKAPKQINELDKQAKSGKIDGDGSEFKTRLMLHEFLFGYCCPRSKYGRKLKYIKKGYEQLGRTLDIKNVIRSLRDVEKLKALLLTIDQQILFDHLPKPLLYAEENQILKRTVSNSFIAVRLGYHPDEARDAKMPISDVVGKMRENPEKSEIDRKLLKFFKYDYRNANLIMNSSNCN